MFRNYNDYWSQLTLSHSVHPGNRFRYNLIADQLANTGIQPRSVLDCGCGDGSLLAVIADRISCSSLSGIDVADNVPIHRAGIPIQFRAVDLGAPVPTEMHELYDLVLCSEVIEHVLNDQMVLLNLTDLTSPGGLVIVTTQTGRIYRTEEFLGHVRHYSPGILCSRMEQAGLTIQKCFVAGWPWLKLQKIAAHHMQRTVQKQIVQASRLGFGIRALFFALSWLYRSSSRSRGPQIVIVAKKPCG